MRRGVTAAIALTVLVVGCSDSGPASTSRSTFNPFATSSSSESAQPATAPAVLAVADCFDVDDFTPGAPISRTGIHVVDCAGPHQHEVYAIVIDPDGPQASYPGDDVLGAVADDMCLGAFTPTLGVDYRSSTFDFSTIKPDRGAWEAGERTIVCALHDGDFQPMTGAHVSTTTTTPTTPTTTPESTSTSTSLASKGG